MVLGGSLVILDGFRKVLGSYGWPFVDLDGSRVVLYDFRVILDGSR